MKSNTLTIIKKEFARFFGDRQLVFTAIIMPGLLIYLIYSLMGNGIQSMITEGANDPVTLRVEKIPQRIAPLLTSLDSLGVTVSEGVFDSLDINTLDDKDLNLVLLSFPEGFDTLPAADFSAATDSTMPAVNIYYNSTNNASSRVAHALSSLLNNYGRPYVVCQLDQASEDSIGAMVWSKILPMLIIMMLFSGVMAIAPSAIAGEKERGTIATLLVTPMRRNELAIGKIVSLSGIALLSGTSSFIGIALSLPNMVNIDEAGASFHYAFSDYLALMFIIFASVLIMASAVSLLSALAKDVKNAGTMITPFMLVVMLCGLMPLMQDGASQNLAVYAIPFYNSIEAMTAVFAHELRWSAVALTLGTNLVYTGVAVWGLTKMFNSEKVMFSK